MSLAPSLRTEERVSTPGPVLEAVDVSKVFGVHRALDGVSLAIAPGTIHALVGENGAGKSTLGKILAGVTRPDSGSLLIDGVSQSFRSPADALAKGVTIISQELALAPDLTVMGNVLLGREPARFGTVADRAMEQRFDELLERTGFDLSPHQLVRHLRLAERQEVEILRALARDARVIVMDEPTAALPASAAERLHEVVRSLRVQGIAVVYVSHFLEEVRDLCDSVTVMRNGAVVETLNSDEVTVERLILGMLGSGLESYFPEKIPVPEDAPTALVVTELSQPGVLHDVNLSVKSGEVVGLFGLVGSGRSELAHALFGAGTQVEGTVKVADDAVSARSPRAALRAGLSLLPESRKDQGLFLTLGQRQNTSMSALQRFSRLGTVRSAAELREVRELLTAMRIDRLALDEEVRKLSGGNQQKVLLAKCVLDRPTVLILDEPTRGVDVGARRAIYDIVSSLSAEGMAVLMISSELDELMHMSHRVLVMRKGSIVAEHHPDRVEKSDILASAFGLESIKGSAL